ncbi:hypothetical protein CYMTET_39232 [Cymbomonas tetramitiformis]|uniref:Band 7 domain-containing protein n=1 Tax=Cymbomonas tetramitiformis TaxID=36881 RepID=A0AAE0CAH6_9CHLO|nr:hypothetical protein CYMTET_39232 [Cymbomonas tetramitiformis]
MTAALVFGSLIAVVLALLFSPMALVHTISEGNVGIYYRAGKLLSVITEPGLHLKLPITTVEQIQVVLQTDKVTDIPCGTKGGVMIYFGKVEVVNRLRKEYVFDTISQYGVNYDKTWIYDKIHHEINQFCSSNSLQDVYIDKFDTVDETMRDALQRDCTKYAPGIEILSVRVTKPKIPESIRLNYEAMEEQRTKVLIATEKQRVVEKEAQTEHKRAVMEAQKKAEQSEVTMKQMLAEKQATSESEAIANSMYLAKEKASVDANYYRLTKEAEANRAKLTPEFLELEFIKAIANNTKMYFGDKIPNMILDQRLLGTAPSWKSGGQATGDQ